MGIGERNVAVAHGRTNEGDVSDMIERIIIRNYRKFQHLDLKPRAGINVLVGDNEAGKSTVLEAVNLALTGRVHGRWAGEEKSPFWFHRPTVMRFFEERSAGQQVEAPSILVELYLSNDSEDPDLQRLRGTNNSLTKVENKMDVPGVRLEVRLAPDFKSEFEEYMEEPPLGLLPTEYYEIVWMDFAGQRLSRRPKALDSAFIDAGTLRSSSGVDFHMRRLLESALDDRQRAQISTEHRRARHKITEGLLSEISEQVAQSDALRNDQPLTLAMDQSARASWESHVIPHVGDVPFGMSGQGHQTAVKVALAVQRNSDQKRYLMVEEPETHQSHTSLRKLLDRIKKLAGEDQQVFLTTHSSYVLNRLGLDNLQLLGPNGTAQLDGLTDDTVRYFQKLSGYDTLRLVLARKLVLVEGPSDEMVFRKCFEQVAESSPEDHNIDIVSMNGITFKRAFELCALLDRGVVGLQDNDGRNPDVVRADPGLSPYLSDTRHLTVGEKEHGETLEPQLISLNGSEKMKTILELREVDDPKTWMPNHKTEAALRILETQEEIIFPTYMTEAVELVLE